MKREQTKIAFINRIAGVLWIVLAVIVYKLSEGIAQTSIEVPAYGPAFYPKVLAYCIAAIGIILVLFPHEEVDIKKDKDIEDKSKFWWGIILLLAYLFMVPRLGFVTATILFILFSCWNIGAKTRRALPKYFVIAVTTGLAVNYLFENFFNVFFPHGFLY
jgi:hypothetical protein